MKRPFDKIVCSFDSYPMLMKKLFIIIVAITLFQGIARAQQYPVQVTPQLLPPYSVKVSDYYSPGAAGTKLNLLLLLRDFNKPQLQVRLRMSIEGQSVSIRTREDAVFTSLIIESGTPYYVDPSALAQYFNPNNLDFSGITRQQYEQTGKLPEGFYTFCFEVIEVTTNQSVSNKGCAFGWLTLNEPPILNIPRKAETVAFDINNPQDVIFQWTPRHTASPTAAFNTEYVISIVLLDDDDISPEAAFIMRTPFFTETVTNTTVSYSPAALGLTGGEKYAWRVQAIAKDGGQDLASFRNQGYSETFWFTYGNNCAPPTGASASPQGQRVGIEWTANPLHLEYKVEYREANNPDAVWFEIGNTLPRVSITDLDTNTIYQYRVGGACEYGRYTFGNLLEFTTNGANATTVPQCGIDPNLTNPPQTLLQQFTAGDTIHAGDYDVIVTQITGQTSFSGEGYVKMSWLAGANVAVRFTNIGINTEKKLASGVIETTYDPTENQIVDVEELEELLSSMINIVNKLLQIDIDRNASQIKTLVDAMLEEAKSDLPGPLQELLEEAATDLIKAKNAYDEAKRKYETSTDPVVKETAFNEMQEAKQDFELAKEKLADVKKQRDSFLKQYNNLVREALSQILNEHSDSIQIVKNQLDQASEALSTLLGTDTPEFSDSLLISSFELDEFSTFSLDPSEDNLLKTYFEKEFKYNRSMLSKWFSSQMNNDRNAEELSAELKKDGKTLGKTIYDLKALNTADSIIIEEIKKVIYLRIEDIIIEKIYTNEEE